MLRSAGIPPSLTPNQPPAFHPLIPSPCPLAINPQLALLGLEMSLHSLPIAVDKVILIGSATSAPLLFFVTAPVYMQTLNRAYVTNLHLFCWVVSLSLLCSEKLLGKAVQVRGQESHQSPLAMGPPVRKELNTVPGAESDRGTPLFALQLVSCVLSPGDSGRSHYCLWLGGRRGASRAAGERPPGVSPF